MISNRDTERSRLTYAFLFERYAVTVKQWIEHTPDGDERGARVEIQRLETHPTGSQYASVPLALTHPVWRADLFTLISGAPGNFDRAHYHPVFDGVEPSDRQWADDLPSDPFGWLRTQLSSQLDAVLVAGGAPDLAGGPEAADVRAAIPDILDRVRRCMSPAPLTSEP